MDKRYTVYNKKTGLPVMIGGTSVQCAAAMGLAMTSFYSTYSRLKNGKIVSKTWEISQDEEDLDEDL